MTKGKFMDNETNEELQTNEVKETKNAEKVSVSTSFFEATSVIVTAITIIAVIFTFFFRLVGVNGSSMQDTLQDGEWLIVTPYFSEPEYGDIVISNSDNGANEPLVKRVIAVAGDIVEVDEQDNVYVNGERLDDASYIRNDGQTYRHGTQTYPLTVPEGCVMLMGDHRSVSWDSRYTDIGCIDVDALLGKARIRLSKDWNIYSNFNG